MKLKNLYLPVVFFAVSLSVTFGQYRILLKNESITPEKNISPEKLVEFNRKMTSFNRKSFVVIQFEEIPDESEKKRLQAEGIELLDYIPNNAYSATVTRALASATLQQMKVRSVLELSANQKMHTSLVSGNFPSHALKTNGTIDLWISFPKTFSYKEVREELLNKNFNVTSDLYQAYGVLEIRAAKNRIKELALLPFVQYVQAVPGPDQAFNDHSEENSRANVLSSTASGNRNLHGEGVVVGIGDNADPMTHIDFNDRIINRFAAEVSSSHGMHVMGTLGGAGIIDERYKGYVPKARIVTHYFSNLLASLPSYVKDYGMVVTNNSYGNDVSSCSSFGTYDLYSQILDQQAFQMPYLQNVFASGNSGANLCSPFPAGFGNVLGGYQSAKNILTVGNTTQEGVISGSSSRGPVKDGRIKPEIVVQGTSIRSTMPNNAYGMGSGTSMASPAVTGSVALLYQQYRKLNGGANPKSALIKALICNSGIDKGNAGPDYKYGFGWLNLVRSAKMLESGSYMTGAVKNKVSKTHTITVPANTAQLKVMLYWNDPAAAVLASQTLVNDLDLEVTPSGQAKVLPKLLDAAPLNVDKPATTGADHTNNIEQVVIDRPAAGSYNIEIKGTAINQNPEQEYFVVYDAIPVETSITYPIGTERVQQGEVMYISWDSFGNESNGFTVQYSTDNGGSWTDINTSVAADLRQLSWTVPAVTSSQAKIKIIQNGTGKVSVSEAFTIVGVPVLTLAPVQCEGYIALQWGAVSGVTDYEVMILQGDDMVSVATTSGTNYAISGLSKDVTYWVSVRARLNGNPGRRAVAVSRKPDNGNCSGIISDNDLKLDAIVSPASSGRKFTSTELSASTKITIRVKNLDDVSSAGDFKVRYYIDNVLKGEQTIATSIPPGATLDHTFANLADLSAIKSYNLKVEIEKSSDVVSQNNTLVQTITQLNNTVVSLPFSDDMESLPVQEYFTNKMGLNGADRYDLMASSAVGRIRTFVNTGLANSGTKALVLDADRYIAGGNTNYLIATYNLSAFNAASDDIRMNFRYKNHGQASNANNKVWIRGKDTDEWIEVYNLFTNQSAIGTPYKLSADIELSHILAANAKGFSSSFQIRWGQYGTLMVGDDYSGSGYSFDDIKIFQIANDVQLVSLSSSVSSGCGLSNTEQVKITVRNNSPNLIADIPVKFQVDNGAIFTETIISLAGNAATDYTFTARADLSAPGAHIVKAWVDLSSDSNRSNDLATAKLFNSPLISSFPYLEDFERGSGFWYSNGTNNSWKYGSPSSALVSKAASGSKAWKTNLTGNYNINEVSYLYSPCFDLRGMLAPTVSFNMALDIEDCGTSACDVGYMEYSTDGLTWKRLGANGDGTNWYNKNYSNNNAWSVQQYTRWHVATMALPAGSASIRLRFVLATDATESKEGIAIDDIHVYDNRNGIYDGSSASVSTQAATGEKGWVNYLNNGTLVASVHANNQNLGTTDVRMYVNKGTVRNVNNQYYLNRNITIKPTNNSLADSISIRFYFLDSDVEKLISASGCGSCGKPSSVNELGISKYSDGNDNNEDGSVTNNTSSGWLFLAATRTKKVPFDKGYFAEFKVKDLSEFWLSKDALGASTPLPVELISFTAKRKGGADASQEVVAEWVTSSEVNFSHFELEVARGNDALKRGQFTKLGQISAEGNPKAGQHYSFIDDENNKSDVRYYRLKMVDLDETFKYSAIRPVVINEKIDWQIYPNPSKDIINIVYQADAGEEVRVSVTDLTGRPSLKGNWAASGSVQKYQINLGSAEFTPGLYLVEVVAGKKREIFRVVRL
ncbi:S8 family serine peptidase [Dyadobacter sp. LHD-138]|uniref:S8 family serine peptidase n=1 Tax=Dyadobacter sp. LHD-138 TaxID=3071413 RepID=UPI0027E09DF5|nr:S8 family serine peptidase [Dyadobacter sp. LHD-138]MDQ6478483.1 S8 family serine peptidase [Dyadobacter sp. LHD-138]